MRFVLALAALSCLPASYATADQQRGFFAGGAFSYTSSETFTQAPTSKDKIELPAFELVGGYKFNSLLGVDIRVGAGLNERDLSSSNDASDSIEYKIDSYQSIYYRPEIINREARLYGLIGYSKLEATADFLDTDDNSLSEVEISESGLSYGLGVGWFVDRRVNVNLEYRMLLDEDEDEFSALTVGLDYRF